MAALNTESVVGTVFPIAALEAVVLDDLKLGDLMIYESGLRLVCRIFCRRFQQFAELPFRQKFGKGIFRHRWSDAVVIVYWRSIVPISGIEGRQALR